MLFIKNPPCTVPYKTDFSESYKSACMSLFLDLRFNGISKINLDLNYTNS